MQQDMKITVLEMVEWYTLNNFTDSGITVVFLIFPGAFLRKSLITFYL